MPKIHKWTENDEILALWLYGYVRKRDEAVKASNPHIIALAEIIHVSPASVVMKLNTIAFLDTSNPAKGVASVSALTKAAFNKYSQDRSGLTHRAASIRGLKAQRFLQAAPAPGSRAPAAGFQREGRDIAGGRLHSR